MRMEQSTQEKVGEECATEYLLIYHSGEQRKQLWNRDKVKCNHCGCEGRTWR